MDLLPSFDELTDAAFSLQMVQELLPKAQEDAQYWKWVIVALHNSLQGFMVLALKRSSSLNIMQDGKDETTLTCPHCRRQTTRKSKRSWSTRAQWFEHYTNPEVTPVPKKPPQLIKFLELYRRIQRKRFMSQFGHSRVFQPTQSQNESVEILNNEFRNEFIHFFPITSLMTAKDFLPVVSDCLNIIGFLAFESNNIFWYCKDLEPKAREMITDIREQVALIEAAFEKRFGRFITENSDTESDGSR
jgi:hypothetical protein